MPDHQQVIEGLIASRNHQRQRVTKLQQAIRQVIADDESDPGGWGPDVTMLNILKQALRESELDAVTKEMGQGTA